MTIVSSAPKNTYAADDVQMRPHWRQTLFNRLKPTKKRLTAIMRWSVKTYGERHDFMRAYVAEKYGVKVGKYSYGFKQFCSSHRVLSEIGAFCSIAENVHVAFAQHKMDLVSTHSFYATAVMVFQYGTCP